MNYFQKKKLAFMSIVNRIKGFIRTVSGALPLTLEGCVDEESIIDYTLYGQSVQDGTPTPETPIEVESVGEKTRNLFNVNDDFDNKIVTSENSYRNYEMQLKPNTTYAVSVTENKQNAYVVISNGCVYKASNNKNVWLSHKTDSYLTLKPNKTLTFTTTENGLIYLCVATSSAASAFKTALTKCISGLQIEEGTTATDYEPYGYKIPIKVSGKNLFDVSSVKKLYDSNGKDTSNFLIVEDEVLRNKYGAYANSNYIPCNVTTLSAGTYTLSCEVSGTGSGYIGMFINKSNQRATFKNPNGVDWGEISYTFTLEEESTITGIQLQGFGNASDFLKLEVYFRNIQLEEGTTASDYEPYREPITTNIYLDEPLRKVGDYADYIDFENGKVVRNVEKYTFTGKETDQGGATNDPDSFGYVVKLSSLSLSNKKAGLCNCLRQGVVGSSGTNRFAYHNIANHPFVYVFFKKTDFPELGTYSPSTAKQVVKEMYDSGVPMVLYYNRNTPTETPITLSNIPTFKGTSIISADTTVQPSNAEIEYYSNVKE